MSTATDTIVLTLQHSVGGLLAIVEELPMQVGLSREREMKLLDLAIAALSERYPQLRVKAFSIESETRVHLWVEHI